MARARSSELRLAPTDQTATGEERPCARPPLPLFSRVEREAASRLLHMPTRLLRRIVGPPVRSPEGYVLDAQSQGLLWLIRMTGEPEVHDPDLGQARRRLDRSARVLEPVAERAVRSFDRLVPGGVGDRRARIYTPLLEPASEVVPPAEIPGAPRLLPGLVWFHGGGFVLGSIESHDGVCRALAAQAGIVVVAIEYRLAPEHRFPAGVDDAIAATRWVLRAGESLGIDPRAVAVGGDSAGGNFAAVVAQALRAEGRTPAMQVLVYPATDARRGEPSHRWFAKGFILTAANIGWFLDHYVPDPSYVAHPGVSPVLAPDLSGLPPALVVVAGFDPLRDEGRAYAERMQAAGGDVEFVCAEGAMHGFLNTSGVLDESARLLAHVADRLRRTLHAKLGG